MLLLQGACRNTHLGFRGWLILLLRAQQLILVFDLLAHILCAFALSHTLETSGTRIASCPKSGQQHCLQAMTFSSSWQSLRLPDKVTLTSPEMPMDIGSVRGVSVGGLHGQAMVIA